MPLSLRSALQRRLRTAQRPSKTLYISARAGATAYGGELDGTGGPGSAGNSSLGWLFRDFGFGGGGEIGYQFSQGFSFGVGFLYGKFTNLDRTDIRNPVSLLVGQLNSGTSVSQIQGLFRLNLIPSWGVSPFVQFGGVVALGQGEDLSGSSIIGYGPHVGGGLDIKAGRQASFFLEASGALVFPDDAVDNSDPSASNLPWADDAEFDALMFYGGGLRYFFKAPGNPVNVAADCSSDLYTGQSGSFTASSNADATGPVSYSWNFGDGSTGSGMTTSHSFSAPGSYTVSVTADGPFNSDTSTCLVNVEEETFPPTASCRVSPSRVDIGQTVTVSGTIGGSEPYTVSVDFGDGASASSLPATHSYSDPGTYTVTVTATNAYGSDSSTCTVTVGDSFCDEVTELNTVYFDYEMSSLSSEARSRLDENIEVLTRCPNICAVINGYADDQERDKLHLSERRADEVQAYYVANGIDESRIVARGLGEHPDSNSKEDPGPGDRQARRADSIPVDCSRLGSFN